MVWFDAHGDLNTPESSPSGNAWGMPLRAALDSGVILPRDVALVGARALDAPELEFLEATGIDDDLERALADADAVYVAFDVDVLDPQVASCFMPEPDGLTAADAEAVIREAVTLRPLAGIGFTGLADDPRNAAVLVTLLAAAGLGSDWVTPA